MSDNVETMMFRGDLPWHGLGVKVEGIPTWEEAIKASGLDWTVTTAPLALKVGEAGDPPTECPACKSAGAHWSLGTDGLTWTCTNPVTWVEGQDPQPCGWARAPIFRLGPDVEQARAVVRSTDRRLLGVVGPDWTALQNVDAFRWFDPFVESGLASYWTAGSLHNGEVVWVLAKLGAETAQVEHDQIAKFILLSNAHRGGTSARIGFTPICVVCANTLKMAHDDAESQLIRVRHTSSVKENLESLREVMNLANSNFEATAVQYRRLALTDIVEEDLKRYVRVIFFDESMADEKDVGRRIIGEIEKLYEEGKGASDRGNNLWRAYQAVTEYLTWGRGRSSDTRLESSWFGDSSKLNGVALKTALRLARERGK